MVGHASFLFLFLPFPTHSSFTDTPESSMATLQLTQGLAPSTYPASLSEILTHKLLSRLLIWSDMMAILQY